LSAIVEQTDYLVDLGSRLLSYGCPTHRLEALIRGIAAIEGYECDVFAVPTGLWLMLSGNGGEPPVVRMVRVKEWAVNLDRLTEVDRIFNEVLEHKVSLAEARRLIHEVERKPEPFSPRWSWLATPVATGASAVFFRGSWLEIGTAFLGGLLLVLVAAVLRRKEETSHLADFIGGFLAGAIAWAATRVRPELSREVLILSIVIVLVPGMALTTGLAELSSRNLVSGAARLMGAMITFLSIVFGIAAAIAIEQMAGGTMTPAPIRGEPPILLEAFALVPAAFAFAVMFSTPRKYLLGAMTSAAIAWIVTGLATRNVPASLAPFLASMSVALFANACARWSQRPAQVFLLPGMVLLVPGSFGFLSLEAFLRGEFVDGASKGFEMFLVAGAIVTGLLLANAILPARKFL
jgi:uncharacterized membrane protein YjjP (DUF1212 family)